MNALNLLETPILEGIQRLFGCAFCDTVMPIISLFADKGVFWIALAAVLLCFKKTRKTGWMIGVALILGVVIGNGILNFTYNRTVTFPGVGERGSFGRYALLWWPEMLLSSAFAGGLAALFPAIGTGWLILIRIVLSAILFSTNFRVEHNRVFR